MYDKEIVLELLQEVYSALKRIPFRVLRGKINLILT